MRERELEIARAWDAARQARRSQQESSRADRAVDRASAQSQIAAAQKARWAKAKGPSTE